jgi:hypothetical protein
MNSVRPSFTAVFIAAYWDLHRVLRALWPLGLIAVLVLIGFAFASLVVPRMFVPTVVGQTILKQAIDVISLVLIAPFLIATHRFVLLGEVTRRYAIDLANPRFRLFSGWLVILGLLASIPAFLLIATTPSGPIYYAGSRPAPDLLQALVVFAVGIALFVFLMRIAILLPAIAVDAPGATWQNAMHDSSGNTWFIFFASLLPFLPVLVIVVALATMLRMSNSLPISLVRLLIGVALLLIMLVLGIVIATRLYQALGDRLNQPLKD